MGGRGARPRSAALARLPIDRAIGESIAGLGVQHVAAQRCGVGRLPLPTFGTWEHFAREHPTPRKDIVAHKKPENVQTTYFHHMFLECAGFLELSLFFQYVLLLSEMFLYFLGVA